MGHNSSRSSDVGSTRSFSSNYNANMASSSGSPRHFTNPFPEYDDLKQTLLDTSGKLPDDLREQLSKQIYYMLEKLEEGMKTQIDWNDYSVYTGTTGIALLHLQVYLKLDNSSRDEHLHKALSYIDPVLDHLKRRKATFLCGDAGPLAVGAVIYHHLGKPKDKQSCLRRLVSRGQDVLESEDIPSELLYGQTGYLYALLFVQHHIGPENIEEELIDLVYQTVIECGQKLAHRETQCPAPLMYEWHDKKYLGAAHGLAGIIYMLLQLPKLDKKSRDKLIRPTLDYVCGLRFPSGNFPSSIGSPSGDKLVHWCHGAPGWIHCLMLASKVFENDGYLVAARECADVIWSRGLLRKGYGLCHGTAGNAYGLLTLYKYTKDMQYLYKALKFAEWCCSYGEHDCRTPDRPYSLFEGLAGTIYFLIDILEPDNARFPAFDLSS